MRVDVEKMGSVFHVMKPSETQLTLKFARNSGLLFFDNGGGRRVTSHSGQTESLQCPNERAPIPGKLQLNRGARLSHTKHTLRSCTHPHAW